MIFFENPGNFELDSSVLLWTIRIDSYGVPSLHGVPQDILAALRADAEAPPTPLEPTSRGQSWTSPDSEILEKA